MTMIGKWTVLEMPGNTIREVHVLPLGDCPPHTAPICWCKPVRKTNQRIWTHNLASGVPSPT